MNAPVNQAEGTALTVASKPSQFDLSPQTFEQALTFAKYMAESDMVPKDYKGKPGNCLIAMQWGTEVGLKPMQSLQNIAVINGRPSIWGDALLALVQSSPVCKDVEERYEGTGDGYKAICIAKRHGRSDKIGEFSLKDAKDAGLLGKQGPWTQYRDRMLKMRARAFALRDQFSDVLKGLQVAEEAMDIPQEKHLGMAEVLTPEKPALPFYTDDDFVKNMAIWKKVIKKGTKDVAGVIATVSTMFQLTEAQTEAIKAIPAELMKEASAASTGPTEISVMQALEKAANLDELNTAADLINSLTDEGAVKRLNAIYDTRAKELN